MNDTVEFDVAGYSIALKPDDPISICEITTNGIPSFVYGLGVRKHCDFYSRTYGMRMALASALKKIPKDDRGYIWDRFFELFPRELEEVPSQEAVKDQVIYHLNAAYALLHLYNQISQPS